MINRISILISRGGVEKKNIYFKYDNKIFIKSHPVKSVSALKSVFFLLKRKFSFGKKNKISQISHRLDGLWKWSRSKQSNLLCECGIILWEFFLHFWDCHDFECNTNTNNQLITNATHTPIFLWHASTTCDFLFWFSIFCTMIRYSSKIFWLKVVARWVCILFKLSPYLIVEFSLK